MCIRGGSLVFSLIMASAMRARSIIVEPPLREPVSGMTLRTSTTFSRAALLVVDAVLLRVPFTEVLLLARRCAQGVHIVHIVNRWHLPRYHNRYADDICRWTAPEESQQFPASCG